MWMSVSEETDVEVYMNCNFNLALILKSLVDAIIKANIILINSEVKWNNVFIVIIINYLCVYRSYGRSFDEDEKAIINSSSVYCRVQVYVLRFLYFGWL